MTGVLEGGRQRGSISAARPHAFAHLGAVWDLRPRIPVCPINRHSRELSAGLKRATS